MYRKKDVSRFINAIDINKENWENMSLTNCYAYALGIDLDIGFSIIDLGEIGGFNYKMCNKDHLKTALITDCIRLNLNIDEVDPTFIIPDDNSWLISMFMTPYYYDEEANMKSFDYHFLRKTKNQNWTQKVGDTQIITNRDEDDHIIHDPRCANLMIDSNIHYNYIGSYLLSKRKRK